ncbi:crAss001_48 related protein [Bacterioplanoides sp.]|uniref:crAss001_48 related protein n=1 Tax=Bacterioplanoides sp. TaxID=2066072 RepID=UPI003B00456C
MDQYIGTGRGLSKEMSRKEYNDYRGWELPADENGSDEGYLIEYIDVGKPNHPDHQGYVSWLPKEVFKRTYRKNGTVLERLTVELNEAGERLDSLEAFMETDEYRELSQELRALMVTQFYSMQAYAASLCARHVMLEADLKD